MTATERFKALFASYVERCCVLEAQLEQARAEIERLGDLLAAKTESTPKT